MKNPFMLFIAFLLFAIFDAARSIVGRTAVMANVVAGTVGSHPGCVSRYAEAAIAAPHVLVKQGTADNEILLNGANDRPLGWVEDTALIDTVTPVNLLGSAQKTAVIIASGDIVAGEPVFTAAAGAAQDLPVVAGTYYQIGHALTAAADGEEFEVDPHAPLATVVA